ncbi:MAG: proprotein convertase P-domain-containing protein [Xanthomonadales bacterium]|nr:proprotein convertase P-domain-containing protein [Xanthomonadales bacterium]
MIRNKPLALVAGLALLMPVFGAAQGALDDGAAGFGVEIGEPVTPVSIDVDLRSLPVQPEWRPGMSMREAAKRQYHPLESRTSPHAPADKPTLPDQLGELQQLWDELSEAGRQSSDGRVSINNGSTGVSPGDPVVDVNADYVIYGINSSSGTAFTIYNKSGTKLAGPTAFRTLAPAGDPCATSVSDPIIHYDRLANRWFMLEMGGTSSSNRLCTYVSKTDNPITGGWWFYGFATPALPDYPHCSVWHNAYVCTDNESGSGAKIYAFDRANMLTGATARAAQRFTSVAKLSGYGFQALTPATFMGTAANPPPANAPVILARHNDDEAHAGGSANGSADFIDLYALNLNWTTPSSSSVTTLPRISITEFNSWFRDYSSFDTVPQPGSTSRLDPIREVILNSMVYRNLGTAESIVGNFATNQNAARSGTTVDSGIRWFELRKVGSGNWTLHQEGTFSPGDSSTHHLIGAIATDKMGNIGMSYNVAKTSSPTVFATLRRTGRLATDTLGVMTQGETDIATGSAVETSGRWGDYHQTVVDPSDDCTFWTVGMYRPSGSWNTRISDFKFSNCSGGGTTTYTVSGTVTTSTGVGISGVTVSAGSNSTTTNSSGAYTISNLAAGSYTISPSASGYTFSPTTRSVTISSANVTGQNFTGTAVPVNNALSNGVPVNSSVNSSSANSDYKEFTVAIPSGASNLNIATTAASGDVDLYVRFGSSPGTGTGQYDCRPYTGSGNESCPFATPSVGTYYVRVYGYATGTQTFTITASWTTGGTGGTTFFENTSNFTINDNSDIYSPITVSGVSGNAPSDLEVAVNIVHTYIGDLQVYLIAPDGSSYTLHNRSGGGTDNINQTYTVNASSETANGTWQLRVRDRASGDTGYLDAWSLQF